MFGAMAHRLHARERSTRHEPPEIDRHATAPTEDTAMLLHHLRDVHSPCYTVTATEGSHPPARIGLVLHRFAAVDVSDKFGDSPRRALLEEDDRRRRV